MRVRVGVALGLGLGLRSGLGLGLGWGWVELVLSRRAKDRIDQKVRHNFMCKVTYILG